MALRNSIEMTTRISDLDSLRHVNNRTYESFCAVGRYRLLAEHGHNLPALLEQGLTLRPVASHVKFARQQSAGVTLTIQTEAFPLGQGMILWNHQLLQPDGETACVVQAKSETLDRRGQPVELLPAAEGEPGPVQIEDVPDFTGQGQRVLSDFTIPYTDMDFFGALPFAALWRLYEESRHSFAEQLGLILSKFIELDTHIFWVGGTYHFYRRMQAGQSVRMYTWVERIVRIRAYIRQEIWSADGAERLGATREEHLIVGLSQMRPKAPPPAMAAIIQPYLEYPE